MNRRKAAAMLSLAPLIRAQKPSAIRRQFIGVWKLVRYESQSKAGGAVRYPYSEHPVGRLTYDAAGRMSALLMNPGRKASGGNAANSTAAFVSASSCEDLHAMLDGFAAYYGTFDVDEAARTVIHHVHASLIPSWVGTDLRRTYEFSGDQLTLTVNYERTVNRLTWQREAS